MSVKMIITIVVILLVLIFVIVVAKKAKAKIQQRKAEKEFQKNSIQGSVGGQAYSLNPASVANEIHAAFYDNDWFGMTEDEEKAIIAINNVPKQFVPLVSKSYLAMFSKNLVDEFTKFLGSDYDQVRAQFN